MVLYLMAIRCTESIRASSVHTGSILCVSIRNGSILTGFSKHLTSKHPIHRLLSSSYTTEIVRSSHDKPMCFIAFLVSNALWSKFDTAKDVNYTYILH